MSANSKSGPLTSSVGAKKAEAITSGPDDSNKDAAALQPSSNTSSQVQKKKESKPATFQNTSQISQDKNTKDEKDKKSVKPAEDEKKKSREVKGDGDPNTLNFYQPSEGSSENLKGQSLENDNINDSGEIIYQQNSKEKAATKTQQRNTAISGGDDPTAQPTNQQRKMPFPGSGSNASRTAQGHLTGYQGHTSNQNFSHTAPNMDNFAQNHAGKMHQQPGLPGPHGARRSGSSKPKKKTQHTQQPIKIIQNINNNNYIFNNP